MNQKEINELRRRFRPEKSAISRVYGCYVNSSKEIVSDLDESLGMMPQEESEKYLSLLKKGLSGSLGKNLIDIVFSTQQVVDSEEHRLLTTLRDSQLKDNEARQTFYRKVIDSLDMGDSSYLLLLVCDSYDVTHRGKDDSLQADASDEVFTYTQCPCHVVTSLLGFDIAGGLILLIQIPARVLQERELAGQVADGFQVGVGETKDSVRFHQRHS